MPNRRDALKTLGALPFAAACGGYSLAAMATESFPSKPITLVSMYAAGTGMDLVLRVLAKSMSTSLGQQVVVDSRPGAGGVGAVKQVAAAQPDGYTLLVAGTAVAISQALLKPQPYDILKHFKGVSTVISSDLALFVGRNSKIRTFADLTQEAKKRGSGFMAGVGLLGSSQHLAAELLKHRTHLDFTIVPYRSAPALFTAMQGDQPDFIVEFLPVSLTQVQGGNLRPLLVLGSNRSRLLPDVPTSKEAGIPGLDVGAWGGILAPARTPDPILQRLSLEVRKALALPEIRNEWIREGHNVLGSTPEQTMNFVANEIIRFDEIVKETRIELK